MKYQILRLDTLTELVEAVNEAIASGWRPLGGIAISNWSDEGRTYCEYAQAMVKE